MKLLVLARFQIDEKSETNETKLIEIATKLDQFYFFQRETIKEYCIFGLKTMAQRTENHDRKSLNGEKDFKIDAVFHVYRSGNQVMGAITDKEYPVHSIHTLLGSTNLNLETAIIDGQEPCKIDKLYKIEKTLDEVKIVMVDNIEKVLQRGEKLNILMEKSQDLSTHAKLFQKKSKNLNACCKSW
jgi:synaptobrevin family protein YKT6